MVAYVRGMRAYNDAFVKKIDRDAIIDILIRRTSLSDRAMYDQIGLPALNPNGGVFADDLAAQQEWYVENGYQTARIDIASAIDTQYAEYATKQLGPYAS
jgi:NitT/TauT family transport system substrate-binding protein